MLKQIIAKFIEERQEALSRRGYDFSVREVGMFVALLRSQELLKKSAKIVEDNQLVKEIEEFLDENFKNTTEGVELLATADGNKE